MSLLSAVQEPLNATVRACQAAKLARAGLGGALLLGLVATPAFAAVVVTNREAGPQTIKITAKSARDTHVLAPGATLDGLCPDGCLLTVVGFDDGTYVLEGNETVSIENERLYYEAAIEGRDRKAGADR